MTGIVDALYRRILLAAHPVGSIYQSTVETSPAELFGGTWKAISGAFLLAADAEHAAGSTGGEWTHKLTSDELPKITGAIRDIASQGDDQRLTATGAFSAYLAGSYLGYGAQRAAASGEYDSVRLNIGGDEPHNNMPPYLAVHTWKRTA